MKPDQSQPAHRRDLYILRTEGVGLKSRELAPNGFRHHLVENWRGVSYPVNESAALVWKCCSEPIRVADLLRDLTLHFPESTAVESEVLDILNQYQALDLITLSQEPHRTARRPPDYPPLRQDLVTATDSHSNCGIIITVHNHVAQFGLPCLKSVLEHSGDARVYLYDNESSDPDIRDLKSLADAQPTVDFIRIDDQEAFGGLTGTWNHGVDRARREGLQKVILLNHDVIVDNTWGNFISAIDSDYCIYGPMTNRPGGGGRDQNPQKSKVPKFKGLQSTSRLLGFCMGFTLGKPELKMFDHWRFFEPGLPFGGNEFSIQKRLKKRSTQARFYVVTDSWVFHHLNMGWKDDPRYLDPYDRALKPGTPIVRHKAAGTSRMNYLTSMKSENISHYLRDEILGLGMVDAAELKKSKLYIVDDENDWHIQNQKWQAFVLSNIFLEVAYISADEADRIANPTWLKKKVAYAPHAFIDYPPKTEYIRLSEFIKENAGIKESEQDYVLLNQRPEGNRYLMESESSLPLEEYLRCALDQRGIPFRCCDFSMMTPADQAQMCRGAKIFISAHGAGISNIIFTPRHCQVLEYNFRRYWNCDPVCDPHFHGVLTDHEECDGELTFKPYFHKADYHNLCRLLDRPYAELEVIRYDGFITRNPIDRRYLFVDGASLLVEIEKRASR